MHEADIEKGDVAYVFVGDGIEDIVFHDVA
jgi:hypothetical protein